jgi:hypothetical protein
MLWHEMSWLSWQKMTTSSNCFKLTSSLRFSSNGVTPVLGSTSILVSTEMKQKGIPVVYSVPDPDSIRSVDPYPDLEYESGSKRAKMTHNDSSKGSEPY